MVKLGGVILHQKLKMFVLLSALVLVNAFHSQADILEISETSGDTDYEMMSYDIQMKKRTGYIGALFF